MGQDDLSALWQQAATAYKQKLSPEDLTEVLRISDPQTWINRLESSENKAYKPSSRRQKIRQGIERYGMFLAIFASAVPEASTLLWGSLELIQKVCSTPSLIAIVVILKD